jgi:hypothetical protein
MTHVLQVLFLSVTNTDMVGYFIIFQKKIEEKLFVLHETFDDLSLFIKTRLKSAGKYYT